MATHTQHGNDGAGAASQVVNSRNPEGHDAFDISTLSADELGNLLDNDYDLDVDLDIPDNLFGADFDDAGDAYATMHHANSAPVHSPRQANMDPAKSVLASMDSHPAEHSIHMHHHAHSAPTNMFPNPMAQQAVYVKDQSGNFVQIMVNLPVASMGNVLGMQGVQGMQMAMASMHAPQQTVLSGVPFQPSQGTGEVQYRVQQQSMMPNQDPFQHFMPMGMHLMHPESGSVQTSPVKEQAKAKKPRRKKAAQNTETPQQQRVRADKGYTEHPKNFQYMRHGEALKAYMKDNKEIPAIKDIFATFAKNDGFSRPPGAINIEARVGGPLCSNLVKQQQESEKRSQAEAETAKVEPERNTLVGVSREEWSLYWKAHVDRAAVSPAGGGADDCGGADGADDCGGADGGGDGDKPPGPAGADKAAGADGDNPNPKPNPKDLVYCGDYPSMEQAARGHDIVALKIHGESARLNFPVDQYKTILPVVNGHTEQELINAVLKDAELAMQRTTKFKGVRKTGPNHYEATVDKDMVTRALQQNAKHEKKAAADGDAPAVHHKVSTFHCA